MNSIGEYTVGSGHDSEMVVNDTMGERNVTCVTCGKPMVKIFLTVNVEFLSDYSLYTLQSLVVQHCVLCLLLLWLLSFLWGFACS